MFPDSQIAKKFRCQRTKTTHILNEAMAPSQKNRVAEICRTNKFSIMMDESNDSGDNKSVAILVRVLDRSVHRITTRFLAMPICNIGTGVNLFSCLEQVLLDQNIPWQQCIGYGSDNASVMVGRHNSVLSRIREKQPDVYDMGCVCHLANTCVQYGLKKLGVPVEDLLVDVFFHFHHSSKRKEEYKDFQMFTDTEPAKIIKHCSTRWLSLQKCVSRLLQQWPALKSYFSSHNDCETTGSRVQRCYQRLNDPMFELTYHFLTFIMEPMNDFNTAFQANESKIGFLHVEMMRLLRKFMGKFVLTKVITASKITEVDFRNPSNQHQDDDLAVGMGTRSYLHDNPDICPVVLNKFFRSVRDFYTEVTEKMIKKFPLEDTTLKDLGFVNPCLRQNISGEAVLRLAKRFQCNHEEDQLLDEFLDYQLTPNEELPNFSPDETRLDTYWLEMEGMLLLDGQKRFKNLPVVALAALSLPHSNADPERCFSMVRKIQTDHRDNLSNKTLNSLLCMKLNSDSECYNMDMNKEMISAVKKACMTYKDSCNSGKCVSES
ncbi:uncharacterized protein LOC132743524 [Ruditapes philippinarum]|uniref:uncharacterized protein LOC132743524 n=1 Tax=Ruditapes philippinarum TaxID=129788 RepID=UPI00295BEC74|nr:uncharacterized protein LOC132743524 [Ruditapes philippinarum]